MDTRLSNNRNWSHITKDGRRQDCVLDKLHRISFEKSRGSDKKYLGKMVVADGRMADVVDIGRWRNSGCGGCGRLWWRKQLAL